MASLFLCRQIILFCHSDNYFPHHYTVMQNIFFPTSSRKYSSFIDNLSVVSLHPLLTRFPPNIHFRICEAFTSFLSKTMLAFYICVAKIGREEVHPEMNSQFNSSILNPGSLFPMHFIVQTTFVQLLYFQVAGILSKGHFAPIKKCPQKMTSF